MAVLDASAVLAYLRNEPGAPTVRQALIDGATCGAANWSETMRKVLRRGDDWTVARQLMESFGLVIEPVTRTDAEYAAVLWPEHPSLSLADRLCLGLAHRLGVPVLTADAAWGESDIIHQIR